MAKKTATVLNKELFDKVSKIKLNDAAAIFGTTSRESMLQTLRKSVAELAATLTAKATFVDIMQQYEVMAGAFDAAAITGLISEEEIPEYYKLIDSLWAAIEHENK